MPWGASQWLRITRESVYGVFDTGAAGADINWIRLPGNNAFTVRRVPRRQIIRSADGLNSRRQVVAGTYTVAGGLNSIFYPSQAAKLLEAALTLTSNDLHSYTLDFWDTQAGKRFTGCKVATLSLPSTAAQDYVPLNITWVGQAGATLSPFTQPADTVFPTDTPFEHIETSTHLSIGGTVTKYSSLGINVKNVLDGTWDELATISSLLYCGRDLDLSVRLQYASTTLRAALEAQTALTITAAWARLAGVTATFTLNSKSYVASVADDLPLGAAAYQTIGIECFYDQGATPAADFSFSVA
jgi:Phage tail tube protein